MSSRTQDSTTARTPLVWLWLGGILTAALGLRVGLALLTTNMHAADEIFQVLEPAHRLWFDWGVISWEWREGIRSWFFPGLVAGLMALTDGVTYGPSDYLAAIAVVLSTLSLSVVVVGFLLGQRLFGLAGAIIAGGLCAVWPDLVYFAPKTLNEVPAAHVLIIAFYLATTADEAAAPRRYLLIGTLLGVVFCFRFQTAPALLFAATYVCRGHFRSRWMPLIIGGSLPILALGVLDTLTWGLPLQSVWRNLWVNIAEERSRIYGVTPPWWYVALLVEEWGAAVVPIGTFFVLGARHAPLLAGSVVVHVLAHMLIAHKELRFLYPVMPAIIVLVGLGTAEVASKAALLLPGRLRIAAVVGSSLAAWVIASAAIGVGPGFRGNWLRFSETIRAMEHAGAMPELCGVGIADSNWWAGGGYTHLHRPVPMYYLPAVKTLGEAAPAFNFLLMPEPLSAEAAAAGFSEVRCWAPSRYELRYRPPVCLMRRNGGCIPNARHEINAVLIATDQ